MKKIIFLCFFYPLCFFSNESVFLDYFNKAKIATFYSSTYLNGFYELDLAYRYADSAKYALDSLGSSDSLKNIYESQLNSLYNELNISKSIAVDNLNYILPHYSLIAGYRSDYNLVDEAEELLVL